MEWDLGSKVARATKQALNALYEVDVEEHEIQIQETKEEFEGELTVVCFPFSRFSKDKPEATGEAIGQKLLEEQELGIERYNVVKGFLNLRFSDSVWLEVLNGSSSPQNISPLPSDQLRKIMVEYSSPNTNKPLHLGHLRNIFLGDAVSRILKANGHEVIRTQIINDRGIHICRSMLSWQKFGEGETPESSGIKGDHLVGKYYVRFEKAYQQEVEELQEEGYEEEQAKHDAAMLKEAREMLKNWENGDPETLDLWRKLNGWVYQGFEETYERMGVAFDKLYYESATYIKGREIVMKGLEEGHFYQKNDGSIWCDLSEQSMDDKLLIRADGTAVYITQDIGTAVQRYEDETDLDQLVYTVGSEQEHHFMVLFIIMDKLGYPWAKNCYHLSYGMVDLPTGKMKSREGTVVDADDLMKEVVDTAKANGEELGRVNELQEVEREPVFERIGIGALKYHLLKVGPHKKILFDPENSIDLNGDTAPFIQYSYARIRSVFRKAEEKGYRSDEAGADLAKKSSLEEEEREVLFRLSRFSETIRAAGAEYDPSILTRYNFELVKAFNAFYQKHAIIVDEEEQRTRRLAIARAVADVTERAMELLGVEMVQRM